MHNFFLTRADGTTAAERFFGQNPRSMFAAILASVEMPPAPFNPPRRAVEWIGEYRVADAVIRAGKYVAKNYFDVMIMNGVIGFGLNRVEDIEQAIHACYAVLAHQGILLVGWNDTPRRTRIDLRTLRAVSRFDEYRFGPLHACHYRTEGSYRHTFSFYRKPSHQSIIRGCRPTA